jgi:FtsZ-interacting cell division protein ZipA
MDKIIIYIAIGLVWLIFTVLKQRKKALAEAEAKRKRKYEPAPNATQSSSYDDLLKQIRARQQAEVDAQAQSQAQSQAQGQGQATGQLVSKYGNQPQTVNNPDSLEQIGPDQWSYGGKSIRTGQDSKLGKAGPGLGQERGNPVLPLPINPSEKAQSQQTKPKSRILGPNEHGYDHKPESSRIKQADTYGIPKAISYTAPTEASKLAKTLKDKAALKQAFILQTVLESKF